MPATLFGWMSSIGNFGCEPGRAKRRQDAVAIFGVTDRITVVVFAELRRILESLFVGHATRQVDSRLDEGLLRKRVLIA